MVLKNLIIFLELLWITPPLIARRSVMPKFWKMSKISYREEDDRVNSKNSCTSPGCTLHTTSRDGVIYIKRQKRDIVYSIDMRKRKISQVSFLSQLLDQNTEQCINTKVCYCKIYIADTCIYLI